MTEEEQEKLYELLFKDIKNKLEATIEKQQKEIKELKEKNVSLKKQIKLMQSCDLAKVIKKQEKEIEALEIIHTTYKEMIEENGYISKDKIRDKIKEYQNKLFQDIEENKVVEYENIIQVLEELLEE